MNTNASTFENAPCVGRWWLWDSNDLLDHEEAAAQCATCPVFDACQLLLEESQSQVGASMKAAGGGCSGTWAGQLIGKSGPKRAQCGTDSGYFRHRRYDEIVCEDCYEAHSAAESQRYSRRRLQASA